MAAWVIAAIERLPRRARRVVVVAIALLLLAGAITALTLQARQGREAGRSTVSVRVPARRPAAQAMSPRPRPPVSGSNLRLASRVAGWFLLLYLPFAYGRAGAVSVEGVTPGLRSQLVRDRAQATPAERSRHPRVVSLVVLPTTPGFAVATAIIGDGGIVAYRLRFALQEQGGRWLVSSVRAG